MSGAVVDASVALGWVFEDERRPWVHALKARAQSEPSMRLMVPPVFWSDVSNALWVATRRRRLDRAAAGRVLDALSGFGFDEYAVVWSVCLTQALDLDISVCDAQYLVLGRDHRVPLWTLDRRLAQAAAARGVPTEGPSEP